MQYLAPPNSEPGVQKRRSQRKHPNVIINQLSTLKHWLIESAKRGRSPGPKPEQSPRTTPTKLAPEKQPSPNQPPRLPARETTATTTNVYRTFPAPRSRYQDPRTSLSPSPLTPHSAGYRRPSGLRGRKSTSSSVSSVRSIHHPHHSKASSTSSTNSIISAGISKPLPNARSPHSSVKVLPATPVGSAFPSNVRLVRITPPPLSLSLPSWQDPMVGSLPSPGLVYAKRRKTPFRGPALHISSSPSGTNRIRESSAGKSQSLPRNNHLPGMTEEDEEGEEEEEIEEVEAFSPIGPGDIEVRLDESGFEIVNPSNGNKDQPFV